MKKNLLSLNDLTVKEIIFLIDNAIKIKKNKSKYKNKLANKTLVMLFQKTSTRTRISFEAAMTQLGGHAIYLDWKTTQLEHASIADETKCIARYSDIITARVFKQDDLNIMKEASNIPVINALSDKFHPCQILADLMTIKEKLGNFKKLKLTYIGDGNNVCNSLIIGCTKVGIEIIVATPKSYQPSQEVVNIGKKSELLTLTDNPSEAVKQADIIYTDTWVSMGQETETKKRIRVFSPFQINKKLLVGSNALIMHCLPAHRGFEITDEVINSEKSIIFDQAENRLHIQKAIILYLLSSVG